MEDGNTVADLRKIIRQASTEAQNVVTALHMQQRSGIYNNYLRGLLSLTT